MPELLIASVNLRGIHDRWWRREPLIVRGLAELNPDVICFQEAATWCLQARWLAWRLKRAAGAKYHVRQARKRGWRGVFEGLAILSRHPVRGHGALNLGYHGRVAERLVVEFPGTRVAVANVHLEPGRQAASLRHMRARDLARWLEELDEFIVLAGDFNDSPGSPALRALSAGFRAAHASAGSPPPGTYAAWAPSSVIDYILVTAKVEVLEAGVFLNAATNGAWPSDHIGLWARIRVGATSP